MSCRHPDNSLVRQISFHLPSGRDSYNFWTLQCSSPCTPACPRCAQNVILFSHMLNLVIHTELGLWLSKASSRAHLGHAHLHGELPWSVQKLYESLSLGKWNDICLTSELFGCLQPTAQPAYYSGHFGECLPSL